MDHQEKKTVDSKEYGEYVLTKIGTVSIEMAFSNGLTVDDVFDWFEKFHPRKYFKSYTTVKVDNQNFELWLPLKKDNPKLKIAVSDKKLQKWKENSDKIWRS